MGRPTKLDDITAQKIVAAIKAGMSRAGAAASAGIGRSTLLEYLAKARAGEKPYADFLDRVTRAEAEAERDVVDALMMACKKGSVPAMQFWLCSRRPHDWKRDPEAANDEQDADAGAQDDVDVIRSVLAAAESKR